MNPRRPLVMRIITRLAGGGPPIHATILNRSLGTHGFDQFAGKGLGRGADRRWQGCFGQEHRDTVTLGTARGGGNCVAQVRRRGERQGESGEGRVLGHGERITLRAADFCLIFMSFAWNRSLC